MQSVTRYSPQAGTVREALRTAESWTVIQAGRPGGRAL